MLLHFVEVVIFTLKYMLRGEVLHRRVCGHPVMRCSLLIPAPAISSFFLLVSLVVAWRAENCALARFHRSMTKIDRIRPDASLLSAKPVLDHTSSQTRPLINQSIEAFDGFASAIQVLDTTDCWLHEENPLTSHGINTNCMKNPDFRDYISHFSICNQQFAVSFLSCAWSQ